MKNEAMTDARLLELIESYGVDPVNYPEGEREAALALREANPERFDVAMQGALEMDQLLAGLPDVDPSPALMAALVDTAPLVRAERGNWLTNFFGSIRPVPAAGALASLAIGALIGVNLAAPVPTDAFEDEAVVYATLGLTDYEAFEEVGR